MRSSAAKKHAKGPVIGTSRWLDVINSQIVLLPVDHDEKVAAYCGTAAVQPLGEEGWQTRRSVFVPFKEGES